MLMLLFCSGRGVCVRVCLLSVRTSAHTLHISVNCQHDSHFYCTGISHSAFFPLLLLHLLMQSYFPRSRLNVPRRNKDVSFSCEWAHVTHCEFASLPNLCSGKRAVIRFESALGKKKVQQGGEGEGAWHDVTSPPTPPSLSASSPSPSLKWKDYSWGGGGWKTTFNLKIFLISLIPSPSFLPLLIYSLCSVIMM